MQIKIGKEHMILTDVMELLQQTYWANKRSQEVVETSIQNSLCFGAFTEEGKQIGFARVVTDYATTFYLCDVVVDEMYRGQGIGRALLEAVQSRADIWKLRGMLLTQSAHGLYEKFGFHSDGSRFMYL